MSISVKKGQDLEVRVQLTLLNEQIEQDMLPHMLKASQTANIKGFRRGKVPVDTIRQMYGGQIREEAIERLTGNTLATILRKHKINPAARPVIESIENTAKDSVKIAVVLEAQPKVIATRYRKIHLKKQSASVKDVDVDDFIERLRKTQAQSTNSAQKQGTPSASLDLPPLDEAFFASFGVKEGGEAKFREMISTELNERIKNHTWDDMRKQLFEQLLVQHKKMLVPKTMVEQQVNIMRNDTRTAEEKQNSEKMPELPKETLVKMREEAEPRVRLALIMRSLVSELEIKADGDGVRQHIEERVGNHPQRNELINWYYTNQEALDSAESAVIEKCLIEELFSRAKINEVTTDCNSLLHLSQVEHDESA